MKELFETLSKQFTLTGYKESTPRQAFVIAENEQLVSLLTALRDIHGYKHLVLMTCVDWLEQNLLQVTYILQNFAAGKDLGVKVMIARENPSMHGIHHLWKHGRVYQQELYEMFGIDFPGSPKLGVPMILESWQGPPPMLRSFDTKQYCEENYSNRERTQNEPEQYMKEQLYPED